MSETTPRKSLGCETRTCPEHGEYESLEKYIRWSMGTHWTDCPKCEEERKRKQDEEHLAFLRQEQIYRYSEESGIPKRFKGKTIGGIECKSAKQKAILKSVQGYLQSVLAGASACMVLCGRPGTGKTHLGCGLVHEVINSCQKAKIVTTANMLRRVKSTWHREAQEDEESVLRELGILPFLVIDEVGVQFGTETERNIFHEIIDRRYNNLLPTVIISNLPIDELTAFVGERVIDRFKEDGGAVLAFDWESHRK